MVCRWDAAKHIVLPSEGDPFWPMVIDKNNVQSTERYLTIPGGDDSKLIPEYMTYMSITDSPYGTNNVRVLLRIIRQLRMEQATIRNVLILIRWFIGGESHDTYCNQRG